MPYDHRLDDPQRLAPEELTLGRGGRNTDQVGRAEGCYNRAMQPKDVASPVGRALWYVERHFQDSLDLASVAAAAGVSRFHLSRAFPQLLGISLSAYIRGRRLSEAARALCAGAPDILALALAFGYGSHEAFTRAFGQTFGLTPERLRERGSTTGLALQEPLTMPMEYLDLETPRLVSGPALCLAGLGEHYLCAQRGNIPAQWQRFIAYLGHIPGQCSNAAYGVIFNGDEEGNFDYLTGVEVASGTATAAPLVSLQLPPRRYAVFAHDGHVSLLRSAFNTIWNRWLPASGLQLAQAPLFERYPEHFDSRTGNGGWEIWMPLAS